MRLARHSHAQLERFFRQHFGDETLSLPRMNIHAGLFATCLTRTFMISAITFGSRILVAPVILCRDENGRLHASGTLIAHEATHVLQYKRAGYIRFLFRYLCEYAVALRGPSERVKERHSVAYRAISFEREARDAERAYKVWVRVRDA